MAGSKTPLDALLLELENATAQLDIDRKVAARRAIAQHVAAVVAAERLKQQTDVQRLRAELESWRTHGRGLSAGELRRFLVNGWPGAPSWSD